MFSISLDKRLKVSELSNIFSCDQLIVSATVAARLLVKVACMLMIITLMAPARSHFLNHYLRR